MHFQRENRSKTMNPTSLELSLSLKPSYVPKSARNLLSDLSKIDNESDKLSVLSDYICKHEEELSTVEALQRGVLPQCRLLLMDAIEALKEEYMIIKNNMEPQAQLTRQPLVEYLPTTRKDYDQQEEQRQIWETYSEDEETYYGNPSHAKKQKTLVLDNFHQINKDKEPPTLKAIQEPPCKERNMEGFLCLSYKGSDSNSSESSSTGKKKEVAMVDDQNQSSRLQGFLYVDNPTLNSYQPKPLTQPIWKNNRRCWSSELHARFVEALNLLGGIEVATPKQIRDFMQVEGLTIDQVKSHLQDFVIFIHSITSTKTRTYDLMDSIDFVKNTDFIVVRFWHLMNENKHPFGLLKSVGCETFDRHHLANRTCCQELGTHSLLGGHKQCFLDLENSKVVDDCVSSHN